MNNFPPHDDADGSGPDDLGLDPEALSAPTDRPLEIADGVDDVDAAQTGLSGGEVAGEFSEDELIAAAQAEPDINQTDDANDTAEPDISQADDANDTAGPSASGDTPSHGQLSGPEPTDSEAPHGQAQDIGTNEPTIQDASSFGGAEPGPTTPPPGSPLPPPPGYGTPPPPGYGMGSPPRRLYRSRHDRKLGGVSAGIAEYFNVDPTIVRLLTLAFAISGIGVLVYLAAWLIVPTRPDGYLPPPAGSAGVKDHTLLVALGVGALALAFGVTTESWAVLAIALIAGGIWLLSEQTGAAPATAGYQTVPAHPPSFQTRPMAYAPVTGDTQPVAPTTAPSFPAAPYPPASPMQDVPIKERQPQRITWAVLSALTVLVLVGSVASAGDWWNISAVSFLIVGIVIIGIGIVAGQVMRGGARGLIPLGLLAALALFPVSAVDGLIDEGIGESTARPLTIDELESSYEFGIGDFTVDLSNIDFAGRSDSIDIDLGIGELTVIVSDETGGRATLQAKAGEISHENFGRNGGSYSFDDGVNVDSGTIRLEGENGNVELNISVGFGTADLRTTSN